MTGAINTCLGVAVLSSLSVVMGQFSLVIVITFGRGGVVMEFRGVVIVLLLRVVVMTFRGADTERVVDTRFFLDGSFLIGSCLMRGSLVGGVHAVKRDNRGDLRRRRIGVAARSSWGTARRRRRRRVLVLLDNGVESTILSSSPPGVD